MKDAYVYFSVPPIKGFKSVRGKAGLLYVSRSEPARDSNHPEEPLGKVRVVYEGYRGKVLENPTWGKIEAEAERAIRVSGDTHHIYLEWVYVDKKIPADEDGVRVLRLFMGS